MTRWKWITGGACSAMMLAISVSIAAIDEPSFEVRCTGVSPPPPSPTQGPVVEVTVPPTIDLSRDEEVQPIITRAKRLGKERCRPVRSHLGTVIGYTVDVSLYQGGVEQVHYSVSATLDVTTGAIVRTFQPQYWNKLEQQRLAAEAKQKLLEEDQKLREAEQKAAQKAAQQRRAVLNRYQVVNDPNDPQFPRKLIANPFAYEGQAVALLAYLEQMFTPTEGTFRCSDCFDDMVYISGIPGDRNLIPADQRVMIVGIVQGRIKGTNALGGMIALTHLKLRAACLESRGQISCREKDEPADTVEKTGICKGLDRAITVENSECLSRQFQAVDGELNVIYKDLMARLDKTQKTTLRNAQRAWVKEKEVKCAQAGEEAKGGTLEPLLISACEVQMTKQRVTFLKHYKP